MAFYLLKRLSQTAATMFAICLIVFLMGRLTGDPTNFILGPYATDAEHAALREQLGLNDGLATQFGRYMLGLLQGDLGESLFWRRSSLEVFFERVPMTILLAASSLCFAIIVGMSLGVISAIRSGALTDRVASIVAALGQSMPTFWLGILLIQIFSSGLGWLPTSGTGSISHLILPAITLGWFSTAAVMRITRSSMLEALASDSIKLCRAKGLHERRVIWVHALRNAALPIVTMLGLQLGFLLSGSVVTEQIFGWPGIGSLAIQAISNRDFPLLQTIVLLGGAFVLLISLIVDCLYVLIDPRIRLDQARDA